MTDIIIRKTGQAGQITLNRPKALNALTWDMLLAIETALDGWRQDKTVALIIIDAAGDKAFCSGGDIAEMYATASQGDFDYGRRFWRDEYRLNEKIAAYTKPIVSFLQGFTMGGGVGIGCHASHRVVCANSQIAMPECRIGLVPDVGGSLLLAQAPGAMGEYLGLTGARMGVADAIAAGFADTYVEDDEWDELKYTLAETGKCEAIRDHQGFPSMGPLTAARSEIDQHFAKLAIGDIFKSLEAAQDDFAGNTHKQLSRNAPLAMATALRIIRNVRQQPDIRSALDHEFRYTYRCAAQGDFVEGIRAAIIDRDRNPQWAHQSWGDVSDAEIEAMTAPLGELALQWEETE